MTVAAASEEDTEKEIESNSTLEATYEIHIDRITKSLKLFALNEKYQLHIEAAEAWLEHSKVTSADFLTQGRKHEEDLRTLLVKLQPHETHPFFHVVIPKAKETLTNIRASVAKASTTHLRAETALKSTTSTAARLTFSGQVSEFQSFYDRFSDLMSTHAESYSDQDKCCLLTESMENPQIRKMVSKFCSGSSGYKDAMEELCLRYGRANVMFPAYVQQLIQPDVYDYTQESTLRILDRTKHLMANMEKIKGATLSQVMAALIVMDFDEEMAKEWSRHLGDSEEIPKMEDLIKFITPLSRKLPSKKSTPSKLAPSKSTNSSSKPQNKREDKKVQSKLTNCSLCKATYHHLSRCQSFLDLNPGQCLNHVKQIKACVNCLHHSHQVGQCSSTYTCRFCKSKHHSLLHKEEESSAATPTHTSMMTSIKPVQSSSAKTPETVLEYGFIHTAMVTVTNGARSMTVRAGIDTCSLSCVITERVASHLQLERSPLRATMAGATSNSPLKHCVSVKVCPTFPSNDYVELTMAVHSKLPPATPPPNPEEFINNPILKGLQLADADFGGRIDILIGTLQFAPCLNPVSVRHCPSSRVSAMSSIFGWLVTGPFLLLIKSLLSRWISGRDL